MHKRGIHANVILHKGMRQLAYLKWSFKRDLMNEDLGGSDNFAPCCKFKYWSWIAGGEVLKVRVFLLYEVPAR